PGQHTLEVRLHAEFEIRGAAELDGLLVRTVLEFDLLHQRAGRRRLDLAAYAPGLRHRTCALLSDADRPRQFQRAVETRRALRERQRAVAFDTERMADRVDVEMKLERAVFAEAADGKTIRIKIAADLESALAFDRPKQRAYVAIEPHIIQHHGAAVGGIVQRDRTVLNAELVDRQRVGIEIDRDRRRPHVAGFVETEVNLRPGDVHFRGTPLATHQRPQPEFDAERAGAQLILARRADRDVMQNEPRRRQQPRVDRA